MKRDINTSKIFMVFAVSYLFFTSGLCLYVYMNSDDTGVRIAVTLFAVVALLLNIVLVFFLRKKVLLFSEEFASIIDDMIDGKSNIKFDLNNESLSDKISIKLKRLYEILENAKNQSEKEKQELEETITDISHQIKTPLTNLKMYNSTLGTREVPEEKTREFYALMGKQIDKLDFLTTQMVKVSRMETGSINLHIKNQKIYETVATALSGIVVSAEKKNITVIPPAQTNITIPHDSKWTAEALFNILDNAVKYTPKDGKISIAIVQSETMSKIEIADTGKGIREENTYRIFKRFFREDDTHDIEGIGIGLYLCREIISKQKGYIRVKSELGKGTVISVFLPNN
ncbi:MAG: HAMP domain-containing sensor histidine kinase [Eubacteriales bacterium]